MFCLKFLLYNEAQLKCLCKWGSFKFRPTRQGGLKANLKPLNTCHQPGKSMSSPFCTVNVAFLSFFTYTSETAIFRLWDCTVYICPCSTWSCLFSVCRLAVLCSTAAQDSYIYTSSRGHTLMIYDTSRSLPQPVVTLAETWYIKAQSWEF